MKEQTRYWYQKRIKELEQDNAVLRQYRNLAFELFDCVVEHGENLNIKWVLQKFRWVFK